MQDRTASRGLLSDSTPEAVDSALTSNSRGDLDLPQPLLSSPSSTTTSSSSFRFSSSTPSSDVLRVTTPHVPAASLPEDTPFSGTSHRSPSIFLPGTDKASPPPPTSSARYRCTPCSGLPFPTIEELIDHTKASHPSPYRCFCQPDARFGRLQDLARHLKETRYHCVQLYRCHCGETFTRRDKFKAHLGGTCAGNLSYECACGTVTDDIHHHLETCMKGKRGRPSKKKE